MTRINVIPASELTKPELAGEWKEISRIFNLVRGRIANGQNPGDIKAPKDYVLGNGHQLFFYTRLGYIRDRMLELAEEMLDRGYNPDLQMLNDVLDAAELDIPQAWFGNYEPTHAAMQMNIQRMIDNGTRV